MNTPLSQPSKLEGAPNFREIGGYATPDGRVVRPRHVFRSQGLHALTDNDLEAIRDLDIKLVCDLRSRRERALHTSRWPQDMATQRLEFDVRTDIRADNRALLDIMRSIPGAAGGREMIMATYRTFPTTLAEPLRQIFAQLLADEGGLPMLVHCSAGKDRTGFVVAMLMSALGISRDVIIQDYMQTEKSINREQLLKTTEGVMEATLGGTPDPEALQVVVSVSPDFLNASFEEVESQHGSVDHYLSSMCGLDDAARERLGLLMLA